MPWRRRLLRGGILLVFAGLLALAAALPDREARGDAPNDVPRFMSVKSNPTNVRRGPGRDHEILWVYNQSRVPVEVIAEHQDWRRIRDWDGDEGWIFQALLTSRRSVIVVEQSATLYRDADALSPAVAIAEPGVVASLLACHVDWCHIEVGDQSGWVSRSAIWGVYADEEIGEDD